MFLHKLYKTDRQAQAKLWTLFLFLDKGQSDQEGNNVILYYLGGSREYIPQFRKFGVTRENGSSDPCKQH
jgi:hypothetical protein